MTNEIKKRIPVILDTDLGDDIDDTWALGLLLRCPELDLRLVVTSQEIKDAPFYRARVAARQLSDSGFSHVPVGAGIACREGIWKPLSEYAEGFELSSYPDFRPDGVRAIIDTVMASEDIVTIIAIGPYTNLKAALEIEPEIAKRARVIAVGGSIYQGISLDRIEKYADYNIKADIPAVKAVYSAPWDVVACPLDVSARVYIGGDDFYKLQTKRGDPLLGAVLDCNDMWLRRCGGNIPEQYSAHSTCLYDTAAVYMAVTGDYNVIMEDHCLSVDSDGYTVDSEEGDLVHCAVYWKYVDMTLKFIADRLCGELL